MCLTIPAQIIELKEGIAKIDKGIEVKSSLIPDLKVDDWILVHANLALKKITKKEAEEIKKLYSEYEK
ncbi:HypC/HybG/HupF family hydrogenase formation chaperone [Patescibacteria group bacterium]